MNVRQITDHPFPGYSDKRHGIRAARHRSALNLHPVIKATGWILAGAGVGSVAVIAAVWALVWFTTLQDTSDTWTIAKIDQHSLVR